jgi:hypothetical protein
MFSAQTFCTFLQVLLTPYLSDKAKGCFNLSNRSSCYTLNVILQ